MCSSVHLSQIFKTKVMVETAFNEKMICRDLKNLTSRLQLREIEVDIRPFVEPNLIRLGYPYTFNNNLSFEMTVAPGCILLGRMPKVSDLGYGGYYFDAKIELSAIISYNQTQVKGGTNLRVPLGDWGSFMPQVEFLIREILKLKQKYDEFAKSQIQASILGKSLVEPYIKEIGLDDVKLEVTAQNDYVIKMDVFWNAYLSAPLTFDNYKKQCDDMLLIQKSLPSFTHEKIREGVLLTSEKYRETRVCGNLGGWCLENSRMTYLEDMPTQVELTPDEIKKIGSLVYQCLKDLGYKFYVKDDCLCVILNKEIALVKAFKSKRTICVKGESKLSGMTTNTDQFIRLLKMTAAAAYKTGYDFEVVARQQYVNLPSPLVDTFTYLLDRLLPAGTILSDKARGDYFYRYVGLSDVYIQFASGWFLKLRSEIGGGIIDLIWEIIEEWDKVSKIKSITQEYPNIGLYVNDKKCDLMSVADSVN